MQVRGPPENPNTTKGGKLLHYDSHRSGLKTKGSLKYLGLYWFGKVALQTIVPFEM